MPAAASAPAAADYRAAVLLFAGFDGTGGAGLLADYRAVTAAGALPLAVATAITAQNLDGVLATHFLPPAQVHQQAAAFFAAAPRRAASSKRERLNIGAIKVGVVGGGQTARVIAKITDGINGEYGTQSTPPCSTAAAGEDTAAADTSPPLVWDPVFAPSSGAAFSSPSQVRALRHALLPRAAVITPNRAELLALAQEKTVSAALKTLFSAGARRILVTDIDGRGRHVTSALFLRAGAAAAPAAVAPEAAWEARAPRARAAFHGSGCLFSSALAAALAARKNSWPRAAASAHNTVQKAIAAARRVPALGRQHLLLAVN